MKPIEPLIEDDDDSDPDNPNAPLNEKAPREIGGFIIHEEFDETNE